MSAGFERWTGWVLAQPWWLVLVVVIPLVMAWRRRMGAPVVRFGPAALLRSGAGSLHGVPHELPRSWRVRCRKVPTVCAYGGLALLVLALARPVERVPLPEVREGIDIVLCLDRSSSMTARDLDGRRSRLAVAREAAAAFVAGRPDDRVGLVGFARWPEVASPPTSDHGALAALLRSIEPVAAEGPSDATGIGNAVASAMEVLRGAASGTGVVVLITDGEENVAAEGAADAIDPVHAAQLGEALGIRVHTIHVGGDGADTRAVERLATRTGGTFQRAGDAAGLAAVWGRIDALERSPREDPGFAVEERFPGFALAGLLLLVAGRALRATVLEVLP